jgi:mono/diheme cytochrome c family protein
MLSAAAEQGRGVAVRLCIGCHGAGLQGTRVAGWAPNLTPDVTTGLGGFQDAQVETSIRSGVAPSGRMLCATMPRFDTTRIAENDLQALLAYLRSLSPVNAPPLGACVM